MSIKIELNYTIKAPVGQIYKAFTCRDDSADWLCDDGDIRAEVNGYALFIWRDEKHGYGIFSELEENKKIVLSWQDNKFPGVSQLKVTLKEDGEKVDVSLIHSDLPGQEAHDHYQDLWEKGLNKLKAMLERGEYIDITERVIVGIFGAPFNAEIAEQLGVPVTSGACIGQIVPGFSAEAAGLQANDVIVSANGKELTDEFTLVDANQGKKPGDTMEISYYRSGELREAKVTLKGYPLPNIPADFAGLADMLEQSNGDAFTRLKAVVGNLSAEALEIDNPGLETNVGDAVVNMVLGQRANREWLNTYTYPDGPRRTNMRFTPEKRAAVKSVHPTMPALLDELRRTEDEIIALLRAFPEKLLEQKNYIWWITFEIDPEHTFIHIMLDRIEAALETVAA